MSALVIAGLLCAQVSPITVEAMRADPDIGYRELAAGRPADALARISDNRIIEADDPAALINRGTAEARMGRVSAAKDAYRAALSSRQRYDLELHDGRWLDSRAAARLAILMLETGRALALK